MAQHTYTAKHPLDGDSKKFVGVVIANGATNEVVAQQGGTVATLNADTVAPGMVELSTVAGGGATLTAMSAKLPAALGPATVAASMATTQAANTNLAAAAVTVGVTEVALPAFPLANRRGVLIFNNGAATIYVGKTGVTTATGFPVSAGQSLGADVGASVAVYGISASAGQDARVLEIS